MRKRNNANVSLRRKRFCSRRRLCIRCKRNVSLRDIFIFLAYTQKYAIHTKRIYSKHILWNAYSQKNSDESLYMQIIYFPHASGYNILNISALKRNIFLCRCKSLVFPIYKSQNSGEALTNNTWESRIIKKMIKLFTSEWIRKKEW